jgi:predicted nucleic acid-binding protein
MMQVVLDANTLASGAVAPSGGTLATIIDLWQQEYSGLRFQRISERA